MKIRAALRMEGIERTLIRRIFDEAPPGAINLGLGQPDLPTPEVAGLAGVSGITEGRTGYTSTAGDPELRQALAGHYRPFASGPEDVLITIGSQEAMFVACLALVDPGGEILYPDPGYPAYPVVARLVGANPVAYPLDPDKAFRLDPAEIERRLTPRTKAVILLSPSNPTGACIGRAELRELTALLEGRGIPWLSDEVYAGFSYDGGFVSPAELSPRGGLVVSSLSKEMSMTGWRVGWVVGHREILARIVAAHQYLVTCAPSVSQRAAIAAFGPEGRAAARRYLEIFRRRRAVMDEELAAIPGIRYVLPEGAFYFFVDVSSHGDSVELARRLLERRKVITIPGIAFGSRGKGFLRISFAAPEEQIREGIRLLGEECSLAGQAQ